MSRAHDRGVYGLCAYFDDMCQFELWDLRAATTGGPSQTFQPPDDDKTGTQQG
jgi:hypothetical protein